jgi:hypothetical protein
MARSLSLKDAFDAYFTQRASVHKIWGYFSVVSLALLGYTVGSDKINWSFLTYKFIAVGYAIFSLANCIILVGSQRLLYKYKKGVNELSSSDNFKAAAWHPYKVCILQLGASAIIVYLIFLTYQYHCGGSYRDFFLDWNPTTMNTKCQQNTEVNGIHNSLKMLSTRSDEMKSELNALTDKVSGFSRVPSELSRLWDELATARETFSREMTENRETLSQINERVEEQGVLLESILDELPNTP